MHEHQAPIAMLDSGVGGLPYLERARRQLPGESFAYVSDSANFPYGTKTPAELIAITLGTVELIERRIRPKALVLACNTASVVALAAIRERFAFPVVGVVPAVKPAGAVSHNRRIGLLATNRTVLDSYTENLISQYAADCQIERVGDEKIVSFVEYRYFDSTRRDRMRAVRSATRKFRSARIDALVIGCTHFVFVEEELKASLPAEVVLIDSREGVAFQLERVVERIGRSSPAKPVNTFVSTGPQEHEERFRRFASRFALEYLGILAE